MPRHVIALKNHHAVHYTGLIKLGLSVTLHCIWYIVHLSVELMFASAHARQVHSGVCGGCSCTCESRACFAHSRVYHPFAPNGVVTNTQVTVWLDLLGGQLHPEIAQRTASIFQLLT